MDLLRGGARGACSRIVPPDRKAPSEETLLDTTVKARGAELLHPSRLTLEAGGDSQPKRLEIRRVGRSSRGEPAPEFLTEAGQPIMPPEGEEWWLTELERRLSQMEVENAQLRSQANNDYSLQLA